MQVDEKTNVEKSLKAFSQIFIAYVPKRKTCIAVSALLL
jgi:hypothetical protein